MAAYGRLCESTVLFTSVFAFEIPPYIVGFVLFTVRYDAKHLDFSMR